MSVSVEEPVTQALERPAVEQQSVAAQVAAAERVIAQAREQEADDYVTAEELLGKKRREHGFTVSLPGQDGEPVQRKMRFRALSGDEYDDLVAKHPPTAKQKAENATWNADTFPPALISAVSLRPRLTVEQVKALWKNKDWSAGEQAFLFNQALSVCQVGLSVPFSVSD